MRAMLLGKGGPQRLLWPETCVALSDFALLLLERALPLAFHAFQGEVSILVEPGCLWLCPGIWTVLGN